MFNASSRVAENVSGGGLFVAALLAKILFGRFLLTAAIFC